MRPFRLVTLTLVTVGLAASAAGSAIALRPIHRRPAAVLMLAAPNTPGDPAGVAETVKAALDPATVRPGPSPVSPRRFQNCAVSIGVAPAKAERCAGTVVAAENRRHAGLDAVVVLVEPRAGGRQQWTCLAGADPMRELIDVEAIVARKDRAAAESAERCIWWALAATTYARGVAT